jgi:hypothetical protein
VLLPWSLSGLLPRSPRWIPCWSLWYWNAGAVCSSSGGVFKDAFSGSSSGCCLFNQFSCFLQGPVRSVRTSKSAHIYESRCVLIVDSSLDYSVE